MSATRPTDPAQRALQAVARESDRLAALFAALGDPTRLKLVTLLCLGSATSIAQLTAATDISRQAVTKHLEVLATAGLVHDLKAGRERHWRLDPARLAEARRTLEVIGAQWDVALGKLQAYLGE